MLRSRVVIALCVLVALMGCTRYGKKMGFKKGEIFYKKPVTSAEAKKLGDHLLKVGYFSDKKKISVQLLKKGKTYQVKFVVKETAIPQKSTRLIFQTMGGKISQEVFGGSPVEVHLCNDRVETQVSLPALVNKAFKKGEIYYDHSVMETEVDSLGKFLQDQLYFTDARRVSVKFQKKGSRYQVYFVVNEKVLQENFVLLKFQKMGKNLHKDLFPKGEIALYLTDKMFIPKKEVEWKKKK